MKLNSFMACVAITILASCTSEKKKKTTYETATTQIQKDSIINTIQLNFNQLPVVVSNSNYIMYPLALATDYTEESSSFSDLSKYSRGGTIAYWNIAFYNTDNGTYHLLDDTRKMIVNTFNENNLESTPALNNYIFYTLTITDFNKDGDLTNEDPEYLFVSDKNGENLLQLSPNNAKVINWQVIPNSTKIVFDIKKDSNNNKEFDNDDEVVPMIHDFMAKSLTAKEVFAPDFKTKLKTLLNKQWILKQKK
jgi:hypothetical protein